MKWHDVCFSMGREAIGGVGIALWASEAMAGLGPVDERFGTYYYRPTLAH